MVHHCASSAGLFIHSFSRTRSLSSSSPASSASPGTPSHPTCRPCPRKPAAQVQGIQGTRQEHTRGASQTTTYQSRSPKQGDRDSWEQMPEFRVGAPGRAGPRHCSGAQCPGVESTGDTEHTYVSDCPRPLQPLSDPTGSSTHQVQGNFPCTLHQHTDRVTPVFMLHGYPRPRLVLSPDVTSLHANPKSTPFRASSGHI